MTDHRDAMPEPSLPDAEFGVLAASFLDGRISPEGLVRLNDCLAHNEAQRQSFVRLCLFAGIMAESLAPELEDDVRSTDMPVSPSITTVPGLSPSPLSIAPSLGHSTGGIAGSFFSGWPAAYLIATVIFAVGALLGAFITVSPPASQSPSVAARPSLPAAAVGQITGMVDCMFQGAGEGARFKIQGSRPKQFQSQNSEIPESAVSLGDTFTLASGLLEITYDSGAKVILQGPVHYEVDSADGGYLSRGKLTARVETNKVVSGQWPVASEKQSVSGIHHSSFNIQRSSSLPATPGPLFTIKTPTAIVTDLGTEFGVEVGGQGETQLHVFRGKIEVVTLANNGQRCGDRTVLGKNESARVERPNEKGREQPVVILGSAIKPESFVRNLAKHGENSDAYAQLVLSLRPLVYYRMERPKTGEDPLQILDSATGGYHGVLNFDKIGFKHADYTSGQFGSALYFRGSSALDYVIVPNFPKSIHNQLSVSAWVQTDAQTNRWTAIVSNYEGSAEHGHFHFGLCPEGDLAIHLVDKNGVDEVYAREGAENPIPRGLWQHVACVVDGTMLRLYRDGKEVARESYKGIAFPGGVRVLGIGCKTDLSGATPDPATPSYWYGRIDELAVFNHTLTEKEIKTLADPEKRE